MQTMKLTSNELAVLKAIDKSEYGDLLTDEIWTFTVGDNVDSSISKTSLPGIISSLNKKGLVGSGSYDGQDIISMTEVGAALYIKTVGVDNVNKYVGE